MTYYDDDGTEVNPDLFPTPGLCLMCKKQHDQNEETLCTSNRMDQRDEDDFICFTFEK